MEDQLAKVKHFHEIFNCHMEEAPTAKIAPDLAAVRIRLFEEELAEYRKAVEQADIALVADALTDMLYVLLGTYITHGLQDVAPALFDEVHRSNMSKLGPDGKPVLRADGKVLKSELFSPPDLKSVFGKVNPGGAPSDERRDRSRPR